MAKIFQMKLHKMVDLQRTHNHFNEFALCFFSLSTYLDPPGYKDDSVAGGPNC